MANDRVTLALSRIEAAIDRIEARVARAPAAEPAPAAPAAIAPHDPDLAERHERLRERTAAALVRLDRLLGDDR